MHKNMKLDETKAKEYIGKTILLGVTYLDHDENFLEQKHTKHMVIVQS